MSVLVYRTFLRIVDENRFCDLLTLECTACSPPTERGHVALGVPHNDDVTRHRGMRAQDLHRRIFPARRGKNEIKEQ